MGGEVNPASRVGLIIASANVLFSKNKLTNYILIQFKTYLKE
jgi:hypothetical protein